MIFIDDKTIKVGGVILPGIIKSIEVDGEIIYEEIEVEGRTDKPKQVTGYSDGKLYIEVVLHGETEDEVINKLTTIQNIFRKPASTVPSVYNIVHKHINLRNINNIVFRKLNTKEASGKGYNISASLEFLEYIPIDIKAVKLKSTTSTSYSAEALTENYQTYLNNDRGARPNKDGLTPAKESYTEAKRYNSKYDLAL